ncbi:MAG: PilZ domain-containing protein [Candidatus Acidiferrum sp.]
MASSNRRITPRFQIPTPVLYKRVGDAPENERFAETIDVSTTGVYFTSDVPLRVAETIEILLNIPWKISGISSATRRFVGRVTRVDRNDRDETEWGIGVQLLYWERRSSKTPEIVETRLDPSCTIVYRTGQRR